MFATATLTLEALVLFFAMLVAHGLADLPRVVVWSVGSILAFLCLLIVGTLRFEWGYWLGWGVQVPVLVAAIWLPAMAIIAVVFIAIWWWCEHAGNKLDLERAERKLSQRKSNQNRLAQLLTSVGNRINE